jgi:hypothetical protein
MEEVGKFKVEKFNNQNYQLWKMKTKYYVYHKGLFLPLDGIGKVDEYDKRRMEYS